MGAKFRMSWYMGNGKGFFFGKKVKRNNVESGNAITDTVYLHWDSNLKTCKSLEDIKQNFDLCYEEHISIKLI